MIKTLKVYEKMFRLFVTVAQSKRRFTSCFVSFKTVFTNENETMEAIMQTTEAQTSPTKPSGKWILGFQTVLCFLLRSINKHE